MNGKYLGVVIGAVVAIMLVGGVLMPIINEQTTTTELSPVDGAYGYMRYQSEPENPGSTFIYLWVTYQAATESFNIQRSASPDAGSTLITTSTIYLSDLPDGKIILYADSNFIFYIENGQYHATAQNGVEFPFPSHDADFNAFTIKVQVNSSGNIRYGFMLGNEIITMTGVPDYYYMLDSNGDYANFAGDNPPSMDTPTVTAGGMYIGPKMAETTTSTPAAPIYLAIPIVILVALLMAVVFVAFRRDY